MLIRDIFIRKNDISKIDLFNIVAFALSMSREELFTNADREICSAEVDRIERLARERQKGIPLAYILKEKEFFSEKFFVDENVLVPRPETETLVEEALKIIGGSNNRLFLLDVGTGSGAIGLTIAKKTFHRVVCLDISPDALAIAKKNAILLGVEERAYFVCSNLLGAFNSDVMFDMILANLPYVSTDEWALLMQDVRDFEPRIALDGGRGGIEIYKKFTNVLSKYLKNNGHVLCEIGSAAQAEYVCNELTCSGFNAEIKKDLGGKERVVVGHG